ncbi:LacI family DNA-binding transcriptional regulator [Mycolicibacterium arseniciresistens]|uniref:LacI family DNA-binding transcriptional regulator n=1 Tax=Mycolicibacterium arseniciresistens TaxID=3062257 RepID=A0ABT8U8Y7_9MYCO|nr:LacI family DNA-binding transcriptional regulator [Mycolicibacterium arseniciresistens]MDO3634248.1 LacI family DNA-binding transcriptional regulator [Mycolicibacterium arseniciresistens]
MQRRTTLQDVADRAGVSRALVSIVMRDVPGASEATRVRVRKAAEDIGYRPDSRARLLRSQRTRLLGVVFTVGQEFHAGLVDGVYRAAEQHGYDVVLSCVTPHRDEARAVQTLLDDRCEGLLLIGTGMTAAALTALDTPVVAVARRVRGVASVRSDDAGGAQIAVHHLADLGHTGAVPVDGGRAPGAAERRRGFGRAARRRNMSATVLPGGLTEREGAAAASALLASGTLPTAVFAFNDRCALGVLDVLIRAGVAVPEDVSVVGFDDSPLAGLAHVDLTTVGQDTVRLADLAVTRLIGRLDAEQPAVTDDVCPPRLVVRGTTAPPR